MSGPWRILLVEDSRPYAHLVGLLLEEAPAPPLVLDHVTTLAAGLAAVRAGGVDAALLDLSLPDARGVEVVDALLAAAPALPVVVLSGRDEPGLDEALAARGVGFVRKGDEEAELGPALRRALSARLDGDGEDARAGVGDPEGDGRGAPQGGAERERRLEGGLHHRP